MFPAICPGPSPEPLQQQTTVLKLDNLKILLHPSPFNPCREVRANLVASHCYTLSEYCLNGFSLSHNNDCPQTILQGNYYYFCFNFPYELLRFGRLNGFPEDTQPVIVKQGPDFSDLGVSPVFKSKGLRSENMGFQQFPLPQGRL